MFATFRNIVIGLCVVVHFANAGGQLFIMNNSGDDLEVILYGDACSIFDEGAFQLVPCDRRTLKAGAIYQWDDLRRLSNLAHNNWVVPLFRFSNLGFTYVCKRDFDTKEASYVHLEDHQLSAKNDHYLELLPSYGFLMKPHLDCNIESCPHLSI